jgi:tetratricopeptide (TPR) repeat protein
MAQLARTAFRGHNYQSALEHLQKMAKLRPDDLKVQHNILIAQYHQGGSGDPAKLLDQLLKLKQRMDESATRGDEEGALVVELSSALIRYNQALLSFSIKHHADALAILEPLFRNIDPLEFVAVKVSFLLLEVYIATRQADKALQVISFIEKTYLRPPSPPAAHAVTEQVPTLLGQTADEEAGADSALGAGLPHMAPRPVGPPPSISAVGELKASLHISRARVHVLLRAFPAAKRELKQATALVAPSSPLLVGCMFLKAHVEYARCNYRKAVKLLNVIHHPAASPADATSLSAPDRALRVLYYADMGAIHFRLKKYRAAAHYLATALKEHPAGKSIAFARREELLYNLALCYIQLREGELAFHCMREALPGLARTPRRCVRLGEAAVMAHASRTRDTISVEVRLDL